MIGGLIELFGVRDKAEYNHRSYIKIINTFRNEISDFIIDNDLNLEGNTFNIFLFRDFCYVFDESLKKIIEFIWHLQKNMIIKTKTAFRCSVVEFDRNDTQSILIDFFSKFENKNLNIIKSHHEYALLYSRMLEIKGIGISADISEKGKDYLFTNYWISTYNNKNPYKSFIDIKVSDKFINDKSIFPQFTAMFYKTVRYKKISAYYIPLLINIASNINFTYISENDKELDILQPESYVYFENYLLSNKLFSRKINIKGIELFLAKIIYKNFNKYIYDYLEDNNYINILVELLSGDYEVFYTLKPCSEQNSCFSTKRILINYYYLLKNKWIYNLLLYNYDNIPNPMSMKSCLKRFLNLKSIIEEQPK